MKDTLRLDFIRKDNTGVKEISINTIPQSVGYSYIPKFQSQNILGRITPIYQYSGGSGESYNFSLELHADFHAEKDKFEELIEDIKSLSAPKITPNKGIGAYPSVYFKLGNLSALVKVETDITWKKPFREGKYIMADIVFNLEVIEELKPMQVEKIVGDSDYEVDGNVYIGDQRYTYLEDDIEFYERTSIRYGVGFNNILKNQTVLLNNSTTTKTWDIVVERLDRLFNIYDSQQEDANKMYKEYNELQSIYKGVRSMSDSMSLDQEEFLKRLKDLQTNHDKFMDYYYDNINKSMTRDERELAKSSFANIIEQLKIAYGGIKGYGATI